MPKKQNSTSEHTKPEIYKSYYWLILNVDPYLNALLSLSLPDPCITALKEIGEWAEPYNFVPDYTKEWQEKKERLQRDLETLAIKASKDEAFILDCLAKKKELEEHSSSPPIKELGPLDPAYKKERRLIDYSLDYLFSWHISKGISLLPIVPIGRNDKEPIASPTAVKWLWEILDIKTKGNIAWALESPKSLQKQQAQIENYLLPDHMKNLKELDQSIKERYFIKDILRETKIRKTLFYELRKKRKIPQHYDTWGNSPYWLVDGYLDACKAIKEYLRKEEK